MEYKDKVVIITGGASGIGASVAKAFAEQGAKVVIASRNSDRGNAFAASLNHQGYDAMFVQTDVTSEQDQRNLITATIAAYKKIDILFANSGIADDGAIEDLTYDKWKKTIDINISGVFLSDKCVIDYWVAHHLPGVIINCGSIHSFAGKKGLTSYAASKGGVKLLTQTLAIDYASRGIRINAICPGYIDTPLLSSLTEQAKEELKRLHPLGRLGRPEEVSYAVLFLASDKASFINGISLLVDGGYTAQ